MRILLNIQTVNDNPSLITTFSDLVFQDTKFLQASYPLFDDWLWRKVVPGISKGERSVVIETRESRAVGLLIVKHSKIEKKLCTVRVRPHFENKGLGLKLFATAFELLETERPLLSVSESALPRFSRIFDHFGFAQEGIYEGVYRPKVFEYSFNGLLTASPRKPLVGDPIKKRTYPNYSVKELGRLAFPRPEQWGLKREFGMSEALI
jgi:hypothetical protein